MKSLRIGLFTLAFSLVAAILWHLVPTVHAQQGNSAVLKRPEKAIDEKVRAVVPSDSSTVHGLADAVFDYPQKFNLCG